MKEYKYLITIAYDGTAYFGWQIQKNKITIQEILQKKISKILNINTKVIGSGRTDAQVHAIGQRAHFITKKKLNLLKFKHSLNSLLPKDIRITKMKEVNLAFHARFKAKSKVYAYHISLDPILDPFSRLYACHIQEKLDLTLLKKASMLFIGKHDFSSFANKQFKGAAINNPIKTIYRIDILKKKNMLILEFEGDGFLYKMVRNIVGILLAVATKKIPLDSIEKILKAKNRKLATKPAKAHGLFLKEVKY